MYAGSFAAVSAVEPSPPAPAARNASQSRSRVRSQLGRRRRGAAGRRPARRRRRTSSSASSTIAVELDVLALAPGDVGGEDEPRPARRGSDRPARCAEPGEHDAVDRPDADGREHRDDRLGAGRHVDGHAIAMADAQCAERRGARLDAREQFRVAEIRRSPRSSSAMSAVRSPGPAATCRSSALTVRFVRPPGNHVNVGGDGCSNAPRPVARTSRSPRPPPARSPRDRRASAGRSRRMLTRGGGVEDGHGAPPRAAIRAWDERGGRTAPPAVDASAGW